MGPLKYFSRMATVSKKRKFVADGVFKAELNEFLTRELAEDGYSGVEVRVAPTKTEIIIMATRTQNVLGEKGRRIRELTSVVQKRFNFPENSVELYAEKVACRSLRGHSFSQNKNEYNHRDYRNYRPHSGQKISSPIKVGIVGVASGYPRQP